MADTKIKTERGPRNPEGPAEGRRLPVILQMHGDIIKVPANAAWN
jgi:hypothetical protein